MKRVLLLLVIGAILFALAFSCASEEKQETKPEEGDSIEQETLKVGESDSASVDSVSKAAKAIEQETLTRGEEEPEDQPR